MNSGKMMGIFQMESGGMQDLSKQLHIDKIEEVIAVVALYRPGPMEMIPSFINRKHGKEPIEIDHPLMKDILELRDQADLCTYTYLFNEMNGKLVFLGETVGFGLPYATQFTNPQKVEWTANRGYRTLPQADPNGLFSPASADGTWVLMKNPNGNDVKPVEPRIIVSPFKLHVE